MVGLDGHWFLGMQKGGAEEWMDRWMVEMIEDAFLKALLKKMFLFPRWDMWSFLGGYCFIHG